MQKLLTTSALILALATPTFAGGPVIIKDQTETIADTRPRGDGGTWVVPVLIGLGVACLILCGVDDDVPPVVIAPGPTCFTNC